MWTTVGLVFAERDFKAMTVDYFLSNDEFKCFGFP